jgi:hypothetical protein
MQDPGGKSSEVLSRLEARLRGYRAGWSGDRLLARKYGELFVEVTTQRDFLGAGRMADQPAALAQQPCFADTGIANAAGDG